MSQVITKKSISIGRVETVIVQALADEKGLNFSSALRVIVREWAEQNQTPTVIHQKESAPIAG